MENKEFYTADEMAFFQDIEKKDIDNGTYKPLEASKLDERTFKQVATRQIKI